ncbi:stage II sporulation protein M [Staphylococcus haemolyticus]|uniref:stage II sporulation protein M n=1 Tax=Staphylococcus haemolyticus TaxID=1283 RepID=UPI0013751184|nr:stage II sporulation protein M [Staphylococcus haemolyticus]QUX18035.1 stage II sporulation protein M [Staphylococcus haemolyticus]UCH99995.1 stage II sporulation protein M [Staphylococcus haemolyticus]UCI02216.1 stage II sporulation protein M [Staphylococcus haemolyticus]
MLKSFDLEIIKRAVKIFVVATICLIITTIFCYFVHPSLNELKNMGSGSVKISETKGLKKVWEFIVNNGFKVPLQMFILALLPIPYLYLINLVVTVVLPGIMLGFLLSFDLHKGLIGSIAFIPHYTFEIMGFCILASALYMMNKAITRRFTNLFRKSKKENYAIKVNLINVIKSYVLITLPLIIIAAFLETYVSNYLFNLMS